MDNCKKKHSIDGHTKIFGLIGNPVGHTLSPVLHNTLAEFYGHNLIYGAFPVTEDPMKAVEGAYALGIGGLNVTVPHKSAVMPALVEIDDFALKIGAVNTLVRVEGKGYKGYNTDMPGLYRAMEQEGIQISGETIVILGAGGAARAVAMMTASKGAARVYVLNRTPGKAQAIVSEIRSFYPECQMTAGSLSDSSRLPDGKFLCIQATSIGMSPNVDRAVIEDPAFYERIHTGFDLVYNPYDTKFMQLVRQAGGRAYNGLNMLLYQGVIAYELWNEMEVGAEAVDRVRQRLKKEMGLSDETAGD
ncbi:MAG: shikimate dehydrogenase [Lachnospiraceae bacterium]|nr:shikimate dehydrogenase [Lachnospiraceae bacterium]